jgi:hypothetical protein
VGDTQSEMLSPTTCSSSTQVTQGASAPPNLGQSQACTDPRQLEQVTPARGRPRETCEHPGRDAIRRGPTRPCRQELSRRTCIHRRRRPDGPRVRLDVCADATPRLTAALLSRSVGRGGRCTGDRARQLPAGSTTTQVGRSSSPLRARSPTTRGPSCRPDSRRDLCCRARPARSSAPTRYRHVITRGSRPGWPA